MRHRTSTRILIDRSGLTLLEVLIAASLLLFVMFGLMQFYVRGRTQLDFEEDRRKATAVAEDRMDSLRRGITYEILSDATVAGHAEAVNDTVYTVDNRTFTVSHAVTAASPEAQAATVALTVRWNAKVGAATVSRSLVTTSILSRGMP